VDGEDDMSLRPIGGIFLRLDASGNLTVYDSSGTVVAKFVGGLFSSKQNYAFQSLYSGGQALSNSGGLALSTGCGVGLTNAVGTSVQIIGGLSWVNASASTFTGAILEIYKNTTGVPALGAGVGTDILLAAPNITSVAGQNQNWSVGAQTAVTVNQQTFFYLAYIDNVASQSINTAWIIALGA